MWSDPVNEPLLLSFINGVFSNVGKPPIIEATVKNPFNLAKYVASKQIVLDVRVKDEWGRFYDIEIQNRNHPAFPNRILYNWSETYVAQLSRGKKYPALRPVISIIVTGFDIFRHLKQTHTVFHIASDNDPTVLFTEDLEIHILRLSKASKKRIEMYESIRSEFLRHWLQFFTYGHIFPEAKMSSITDNDPAILSAFEQLDQFYADADLQELDRQRRLGMFDQMAINDAVAKGKVTLIVRLLMKRFGSVPSSLEKQLSFLTDIDKLDNLADFVLDCNSIKEFSSHLR
jgi:predicted transposase/invertase (TIGR01784 family)